MSNIKINNLTLRDYKYYKLIFKYNLIKSFLKNNNFLLFFYYDFLTSKERIQLKKKINDKNLKMLILKKNTTFNFLSNKKFKLLNNLINNNIIIVYNKENLIIENKIIKQLINSSNLKLVGALWNKKLYRPTKIKKYAELNSNISINIILILKYQLNKIRFNLSNLKKII